MMAEEFSDQDIDGGQQTCRQGRDPATTAFPEEDKIAE